MSIVNIVNRIRADGSQEYVERVPLATRQNIAAVANPILTYSTVQNEFLTNFIGKIALTVIDVKIAKNPLAVLKRGTMPLGSDIEEIFTRMAEGSHFDGTGSTLLTQHKPSTEVMYHRRNRQDTYPVTVSKDQLATAFTSWGKLEEFLTSTINTLYSGDNYDEFILMKNLVADAVTSGKMRTVQLTAVTDESTSKAFVKAVRKASALMPFPSSAFNMFKETFPDKDPIITWTPKEDQILLIRSDVATEIDVEVLAVAFNMDKTTLLSRMIEIDSFGAATNCMAMLCDRSFFMVMDTKKEMTEFWNAKSLCWTYYWHHFQTYSFSLFANAVAFVTADVNISAFDSIDSISGNEYANGGAVSTALLALYPYVYAEAAKVPVTAWVDTDTFNGAFDASYTFTATLGTLPEGFTNTGNKTATIEVVVDDNP